MDHTIQFPSGVGGQDLVGMGITAVVARLDAVIKFASSPLSLPLIEREKDVYLRLGHDHDGVVRYFGNLENALVLQYASNGSIRQYIARQGKPVPLNLRLRWVEQIVGAITFIHSKNVLHGDISCNNIFLDIGLNTKLGDFAGSAIDEKTTLIGYETSHEHPSLPDTSIQTEIFALGSTIYEIMTGSKPYNELTDPEICEAYNSEHYPDLTLIPAFDSVIENCWNRHYNSVDELVEDVKVEAKKSKLNQRPPPTAIILSKISLFPVAATLLILFPIVLWARRHR